MATYRLKVPKALHRERFDKVVHTLLNTEVAEGVSKSVARKLVMAGACYLNGSRCRIASKPVFSGGEVRVEYDAARVRRVVEPAIELTPDCILYHRDGLLIVNKPANLPTVPTLDDARNNLVAALKQLLEKDVYLGDRTDRPRVERSPGTSVYLGIHHRLDAQTSGCILFTTDENRNAFVSKLFQEHLVQKEYLAVCTVTAGNPPTQWEIKNQLMRAEKKRNRYASTAKLGMPDAEGSFAYSRFEVLQQRDNLVLVKCIPVTGRTHQLRVHLSEYGLPILGDRTYGTGTAARQGVAEAPLRGAAEPGAQTQRLMLHAQKLAFREEGTGTEVVIEAPVPEEFQKLFS